MFVKSTENFLAAVEKKVSIQKMSKNEPQNRVGIFWQNPIFGAETFFQRPLKNFLLALRTCSRYLKGPLNLAVCVSKKIVTIWHTNRIICQEKWKKLRFWKNEAEMKLEYFDKTSLFELQLFFERLLENVCMLYRHVQGIQKVCLALFFGSEKNQSHITKTSD